MPIPFILVTGFLGAGKTTFLKKIINSNSGNRKIGIVQNEFAPANVDGEELLSLDKPFEMLEINNGSVFCVCLLGDFIESLQAFIHNVKPDLVILESSGLSDPIAISEILGSDPLSDLVYLGASWCIIDVPNFERVFDRMIRVNHQILIADYILLNKIDLASQEKCEEVDRLVRKLNPMARRMHVRFCDIDTDIFYQILPFPSGKTVNGKSKTDSCGSPPVRAGVFKTSKKINLHDLNELIRQYTSQALRIKGYVALTEGRLASVQSIYDDIDIRIAGDKTGNTALILMGESFNLSEFAVDFRKLTR